MTDVQPQSFSGYVGMHMLPPFPLDMWWPCDNQAHPIDQRNDSAPDMHYLENKNGEWLFRRGAISPIASPPLDPSSITQQFQSASGSTDPSSPTISPDGWKHFGPPLLMHAGGSISLAWFLQRVGGAFSADYFLVLNGVMRVDIHVDNSGTSASRVLLWDGVSQYVALPTNITTTMMPARNGGILAGMLILDNVAKMVLAASATPSGTSVFGSNHPFTTYAPASNWWLGMWWTQNNFKFANIYVWRRALTTDERTVWFKHAARVPNT